MKYVKTLHLHIIGIGLSHLIYLFSMGVLALVIIVLSPFNQEAIYLIQPFLISFYFITPFIFSFYIGLYTYQRISVSYLSLKMNRKTFFQTNFVYAVLHSILTAAIAFGTHWIFIALPTSPIYQVSPIPMTLMLALYGAIASFVFFCFVLGSFTNLFMKNPTIRKYIKYVMIVGWVSLIFASNIVQAVIRILSLNFGSIPLFASVSFILLVISLFICIANRIKFIHQ